MGTEERQAALVEFMGTFMTVHETINDISELSDGVIMFEALSEMYVIAKATTTLTPCDDSQFSRPF